MTFQDWLDETRTGLARAGLPALSWRDAVALWGAGVEPDEAVAAQETAAADRSERRRARNAAALRGAW